MDGWHHTGCVLCAQNCGLEIKVDANRITRVRPDKTNPRSRGYACRQNDFYIPDEARADMLLAVGWNGMQSHQMPRAPLVLKAFSTDPDKLLVVIDPRKSETARIADIHLALRPGTDALMVRAMIAIILEMRRTGAP